MTKLQFLYQLEKHLKKLSNVEKDQTISYYSEMIDDMIESGLSEEQAVNKLGNPKDIAKQCLNQEDTVISEINNKKESRNTVGVIFAMIGIIFSLIIIGSIFVGFVGFGFASTVLALMYIFEDTAKLFAFSGFALASYGFAGIMYFIILIHKDIIKKITNKGGSKNEKTPNNN